MKIYSTRPICIIGGLYDIASEKCEQKSVFINDGRIVKIIAGQADEELLESHHVIRLEENEVILPTFLNLHAHIGYNVLPLWNSPSIWTSRHQWRNSSQYQSDIKGFVDYIKVEWAQDRALLSSLISDILPAIDNAKFRGSSLDKYFEIFGAYAITEIQKVHAVLSEIMAVSGGTGVLLQTLNLEDEEPAMKHFLIRNTGNPEDIDIPFNREIFDVVDFFKPDPKPSGEANQNSAAWSPVEQNEFKYFLNSLTQDDSRYFSTIAHLGEGNTKDAYSKAEGNMLMKRLRGVNPDRLKASNLVLVHANGIDYQNSKTLKFLSEHQISIVWSPVSNMLLYNDTLPIGRILDAGINVALGTDWTPSGSKHMLDEIKFAWRFCEKFKLGISENTILKMATVNPAVAIGKEGFGHIQQGSFADMLVYRVGDIKNIARSMMVGGDDRVKFVMINGRIVYGDDTIFETLKVDRTKFPASEGSNVHKKAVSINSGLKFELENALVKMDRIIQEYRKGTIRPRFLSSDDKPYQDRIETLVKALDNYSNQP